MAVGIHPVGSRMLDDHGDESDLDLPADSSRECTDG